MKPSRRREQKKPSKPSPTPLVLPLHPRGLRIGLFGGTFDPPHAAHREVSLFAMKRLGLHRVWWLITPGNPLKDTRGLPSFAQRMAAARAMARHPRIDVTDIENVLGFHYSVDTLRYLLRRCRGVSFVWVMGADNLKNFHHWRQWRAFARLIPLAFVDRGGSSPAALAAPVARLLARSRIPESEARRLAGLSPPAWVFLHGLKSALSSTELRHERRTGGG
jgi:nicotinate-nucleotide adenylyltransferase